MLCARHLITAIAAFGLIFIIGLIYQSKQQKPDVGWAPTPVKIAVQGLTWASIGPNDLVYELGCGDGRVAIVAAQLGSRVVCIEIDPGLATAAAAAVKAAGLEDRVDVLQEDFFNIDLSPATVIFMFLLPSVNERLRPIFEANLRPGTRIISREFEIKGWLPGERLELPGFLFLGWTMGENAGQPLIRAAGSQSNGDDKT
jgi:SAM-dependent methyltransferase